jgi:hypothetical protein
MLPLVLLVLVLLVPVLVPVPVPVLVLVLRVLGCLPMRHGSQFMQRKASREPIAMMRGSRA